MSRSQNGSSPTSRDSMELRRRVSGQALFRRRAVVCVLTASLMLQQACYTMVPVAGPTSPPSGLVTIDINDRGRLLVGSKLGSLVDKVVGRVVRSDSVNVEVAVETAEDARGSLARWGGERFTIPREGIGAMQVKKISRKRTWALIGGIVVGLIVGLLALNSSSSGGLGDDGPGPDPI